MSSVHTALAIEKPREPTRLCWKKAFDILSSLTRRFLDTRALERGRSQIYNDFTIFNSEVSMLVSSSAKGEKARWHMESSFIPNGRAQGYVTIGE
jgi:hypothetical protein